ncbi:uncharacterized protein LOC131927255 [Physella acuta]|uniref:uncharacterized protein LOC131927255 n=1 Tax=Physella acuta TaxID=109671 RepID=UPI0027DE9A8C|nr:uncharacterized protein LOC131927255 [Physella acuta]
MDGHVSNRNKFIGDGKNKPTNWIRGQLLGRGAHAKVYLVTHLGGLTGKCAVKQVLISEDNDSKHLETIKKELKVFQKVRHHRIVDYYDFTITQHYFYLFIGCYEKGSLAKYIKEQPDACLTEQKAAIFTLQLLEGLDYLHNKKIIHRDIKGSNILMEDDYNIKISDFGIAEIVSTLSRSSLHKPGTPNWMAPEMWQKVPHDSKVDIWSLGCTVYQMITGEMPLRDLTILQIMSKANKNELEIKAPEHCSSVLKGFVSQACEKKPTDRPSANELIQHIFVKGHHVPQIISKASKNQLEVRAPELCSSVLRESFNLACEKKSKDKSHSKKLIQHFYVKDLKATDTSRRDDLQQASRDGKEKCVNKLLETGYDVNIVDENGMNYLMSAASFGREKDLIRLLEEGSNVNKLDNNKK